MQDDPGHVFVTRGDLTRLACQAVVVPTSRAVQVNRAWAELVPLKVRPAGTGWLDVDVVPPQGWGEQDRVLRLPDDASGRQVWLARTDAWRRDGVWVAEGVAEAVRRAAAVLPPPACRDRPLVGVPLAGTGEGGLHDRRGEVVAALLPALGDVARTTCVDVALVLHDDQDHSAVQAERAGSQGPGALQLDVEERDRADFLGRLAGTGHLVLFLGAGISLAAGLPSWKELLLELTELTGLGALGLESLPAPDAAQILYDELGEGFAPLMQKRFTLQHHALAHALLAGLGADAVVTTNYDNGYELAAAAVQSPHRRLRVLPREHAEPGSPWLLKMHGDVVQPHSIVLTRDSYLDYGDTSAPLTGMVQALLMTRHMLFVGFSLVDDNFARLAHQVRRVLHTAEPSDRRVGTVLALKSDPARERLWRDDLDHVPMSPVQEDEGRAGDLRAARRLEIFLDRVAWRAATVRGGLERSLLDPRYDAMLREPSELRLRERLQELNKSVGHEERSTQAWAEVQAALVKLGLPATRPH